METSFQAQGFHLRFAGVENNKTLSSNILTEDLENDWQFTVCYIH